MLVAAGGCNRSVDQSQITVVASDPGYAAPWNIQFKDHLASNSEGEGLLDVEFVDPQGQPMKLRDRIGEKNLIVVVTRGYNNTICMYCSTQTARLMANYKDFSRRNAEVLVVFPVETDKDSPHLKDFIVAVKDNNETKAEIPFPLVLDVGLKAVDSLGIRAHLSKPATYIIDRSGNIRFAYVGESLADRPSVKAILEQLDALAADEKPASG